MKIDFHAHILPDMDHGCEDVAMSVRQLQMAKNAGMDVVVATSHFYGHIDTVKAFVSRREQAYADLCRATEGLSLPKVLPGAETLIGRHMEEMDDIESLCIQGTNVLLLEMPFSKKWEDSLIDTAVALHKKRKLEIVLAHVNRYPYEAVKELLDEGLFAQLNANSICSLRRRKLCRQYLATDRVVAFGSDIHLLRNNYRQLARVDHILGAEAQRVYDMTARLLQLN